MPGMECAVVPSQRSCYNPRRRQSRTEQRSQRRVSIAEFRAWAAEWGDIASVIGFGLTIIGFAITIFGVWRSKSAAEQARQAAITARESIAQYDVIADLSAAMAIMDEIKRHQRQGTWSILPDRYSDLRRRLATIRGSQARLPESQRQILQLAIGKFADQERVVERAIANGVAPPRPDKLNEVVSSQIDEVHAVLLALQRDPRSE